MDKERVPAGEQQVGSLIGEKCCNVFGLSLEQSKQEEAATDERG